MTYPRLMCALILTFSGVTAPAAITPPTIKISPATFTLRAGESKTFSASTTGLQTSDKVVWSVVKSSTTQTGALGTVSSTGVYAAPAVAPAPDTVIVRAESSASSAVFATSVVTILNPLPTFSAVAPTTVNTGLPYTLTLKGTNFSAATQVLFDGKAVPSAFVSSTELAVQATSIAPAGTKIAITISNPGPSASTGARTLTVEPPVTVLVSPDKQTIRIGQTRQFYARVSNTPDQVVTWQVNGKAGGDALNGTIDDKGLYTPPAVLPALTTTPSGTPPGTAAPSGTSAAAIPLPSVTITAISHADPKAGSSVTLSLENGMPVVTSVTPNPVKTGTATLTVTGTGFAPGAVVHFAGTAFTTTFVSDKKLTATGTVDMPVGRVAAAKVSNPAPGPETSAAIAVNVQAPAELMTYADASRFLQLASFGPSPDSVVELQTIGRDAWLAKQFAMPASAWPEANDANEGTSRLKDAFFTIALKGPDQLRQRVAFALAEILVSSAVKDMKFSQMVSYQRLLGDDAFKDFRTLLHDMTLNPAMGYFLDMVNNDKANPKANTVANENYAREVMQLFSIGLVQLDSRGVPIPGVGPEYTQHTVTEMARVFTGWTYAPVPGFASHWKNTEYDFLPMVPFEDHHDNAPKSLDLPLPCTIAGGTAASDLDQTLDCLLKQSSVAPFISSRLIQRLVKSAPSADYVGRVAAVFTSSRGNLPAVIKAILTDDEAKAPGSGKLNEPVLFATQLLRALDATVTGEATGVRTQTASMGQDVLSPNSVFSYFSPFFRTPVPGGAPVVAPEFQAMNAETAFGRMNFAWRAVSNQVSGNIRVDFSNLQDLSGTAATITEAASQALYQGGMGTNEKSAVAAGIAAGGTNTLSKVRNAFYVAAGAPQYQVEQ